MKIVTDQRATQQILICMNRVLKNKNSVNKLLSEVISLFSHGSIIQRASKFESRCPSEYFIVDRLHSPFWATTFNLPSRVVFYQDDPLIGTNFGSLRFTPDWRKASKTKRKRIFDPFGHPYIKKRNRKFFLERHLRHGFGGVVFG